MARSRWRWDKELGQLVSLDEDWTDAPSRAQTVTEELVYGGVRMTDGTDVSSRKKHREYLKSRGLAMASDFTETTARAQREKLERAAEKREIRETVGRAFHEMKTQRKR